MTAYQLVKVDHPLLHFIVDGGESVLDLPPARQDYFWELAAVTEVLEPLLPGLSGGAIIRSSKYSCSWCTGLQNKVCPRLRDSACWRSG